MDQEEKRHKYTTYDMISPYDRLTGKLSLKDKALIAIDVLIVGFCVVLIIGYLLFCH